MMREEMRQGRRAQRVAGRFVAAVDRALIALEELKKARAALSKEANQPTLKLVSAKEKQEK